MSRLGAVLFLFFLLANKGYSQGGITGPTDSTTVYSIIDNADKHFNRQSYDSALLLAGRAEAIAKSQKLYKWQGWALVKMTEVLIEQRQLKKAYVLAQQTQKIGTRINDTMLMSVALLQQGQSKMYEEEVDEAILLLDKSIVSGLGRYPNDYLALAFNDLGYAWGLKDEYERQALFTLKALTIYETLKNDAGIGMTLSNLSTVYNQLDQKEKAIEYAKQSLKYREKAGDIEKLSITCCNLSQYYLSVNKEEAVKYQELCVKYAKESGIEDRMVQAYIASSLIANANKNNKEAFEYELKVIELLEKSGKNPRMLARRYIAAAFYTDMLQYDSAQTLDYYNRSLRLSSQMDYKSNLKDVYFYLSEFHRKKQNFPAAYENYKKHILYRDSLISSEKEEKIAELEARYETNRKDNEIIRLNNEKKIKQLEIEKQKAIIEGNMASALQKQNEIDLLSKSRELQQIKIRQQGEELEKQLLLSQTHQQELQIKDKENQLRQKQLKSQKQIRNLLIGGLALLLLLGFTFFNRYQLKKKLEQQKGLLKVRNEISRDLHDDIGASLSNINILNELARRNIAEPEKSKEYLAKAGEDIQRISESLSDIVWNINPRYDDAENLFIRMKRYAADMFDGKQIIGEFDFPDSEMLAMTMTQRRDMYLVFKEAVNNLVKYSGAQHAWISVRTEGKQIALTVKDDGNGFERSAIKSGNGLQNMEQRAKSSGAELNIQSQPGKGTMVILTMKLGE